MLEYSAYTPPANNPSPSTDGRWAGEATPRHLKVTGVSPAYGFERCEDVGCSVQSDGIASSCGRHACPACGCGGTHLTAIGLLESAGALHMRCSCGYAWMR